MILRYLLSLSILSASFAHAQTQNALDFDGVNDEVTVANASAQIANQTGFSLTSWVYPTNAASNWPNMEAYAGFRDNAGCDFYLLQTYGTTMEGRFRNSAAGIFTLDSAGVLVMNTWQFVALTYDGTTLSMYHNAVLIGSMPASGTITNTTGMFRIGNMPIPGSTQIFLDGQVDETTLWRRGLTQAELQCIMNNGADPEDADLRLYYRMDQGVPGGANTGLTSLIDASGHQNGTLAGFALSGATSNYVAGSPNDGTTQAMICSGGSYVLGGEVLTDPGTYTTTIPIVGGCDSVVVLELAVTPVNVNVAQNNNLLIASASGAVYQWVDCDNGYAAIPGATGQFYTATTNGDHAVIVTQNNCTDTSACFNVTGIGIEEIGGAWLRVQGDVVRDALWIEVVGGNARLITEVLDPTGRVVLKRTINGQGRQSLDVQGLTSGMHFLRVSSAGQQRVFRFVKE